MLQYNTRAVVNYSNYITLCWIIIINVLY